MAIPSVINLPALLGNLRFSDGGIDVDFLLGSFVKSVTLSGGVATITFQNSGGAEKTAKLPAGWAIAGEAPSSPYDGQGWYDTAANVLKIYDGTAFRTVTAASRTIITDDPANRVAPTAANAKKLLFRNNTLFRQSVHHGAGKIVTWAPITDVNLPKYKGAYNSISDLPLLTAVGEIRFVRRGGHFVKATNTGGRFVDFVPLTFIGSWTRQIDAERHAMRIGDIAGFISNTGPNRTQLFPNIVTAYTAPAHETRLWVRIDDDVLEAVARSYFGFRLSDAGSGVDARRLTLVRPNTVEDAVADLGVQVVLHATRDDYNDAADDDNRLHIITVA